MSFRTALHVAAIALFLPGAATCCFADVHSTFDDSADGWRIADLATGDSYIQVLGYYDPNWHATGGDPDGYISRLDPSSNTIFFEAPDKFLGDQTAAYGRNLHFSLQTDYTDYDEEPFLLLISGDQVLLHEFTMPGTDWTRYSVLLDETSFYDHATGLPVSSDDFLAILGDLEALRISAEYGMGLIETTSLDRVRLERGGCVGDLDGDGDTDQADLGILLAAYGLTADGDLNADGTTDQSDLGILL
ncbi:MAG: laminin B domain-containing protein, partial [Phycisphaerales bacterium JB038]